MIGLSCAAHTVNLCLTDYVIQYNLVAEIREQCRIHNFKVSYTCTRWYSLAYNLQELVDDGCDHLSRHLKVIKLTSAALSQIEGSSCDQTKLFRVLKELKEDLRRFQWQEAEVLYDIIVGREKKLLQTQKLIQQLVKAINPANQVDEILLKKYVDAVNDLLGLRINPLSIIHHKKETNAFLNDQELLTFYEIRHIEVYYFLKICQCSVVSEADVERLFSYLKRTTGNHLRQRMSVDTYKWLCYVKIHNSNKITEEDDIEFLPGM
ncbi:Conserved_hypothetical protein [Hexamita inflata]|uniref:Uncharacterized protein n=1 Tax=Hexamita inflata TaxID=28002 RepID=A0AA86UUU9_9EUKA|nr:Conserved hypothetical protein [Hexamita inflata]